MIIFRIILLFFLGLLGRRLYVAFRALGSAGGRGAAPSGDQSGAGVPGSDRAMKDLTEQDISDADFEEIP